MKARALMGRLEYERRTEALTRKPKTYEQSVALFEQLCENIGKDVWELPSLHTKSFLKRRVLLRDVNVCVDDRVHESSKLIRSKDSKLLGYPSHGFILCSIKYLSSTGRTVYCNNINAHFIQPIEGTK